MGGGFILYEVVKDRGREDAITAVKFLAMSNNTPYKGEGVFENDLGSIVEVRRVHDGVNVNLYLNRCAFDAERGYTVLKITGVYAHNFIVALQKKDDDYEFIITYDVWTQHVVEKFNSDLDYLGCKCSKY